MVYQYEFRLAERFKSGGPSLGRSPDAHKQRRPVNQEQIQIFGENRVDTIFEQGLPPCSFFLFEPFEIFEPFERINARIQSTPQRVRWQQPT